MRCSILMGRGGGIGVKGGGGRSVVWGLLIYLSNIFTLHVFMVCVRLCVGI